MQRAAAAHAEERRLIAEYQELGYIRTAREKREEAERTEVLVRQAPTLEEAYRIFSETKAITRLKATTKRSYDVSLATYLLPRWKKIRINELGYIDFERLDAQLKKHGLKPSSRANVLNAGRSILRYCVDSKLLADFPRLPPNPKPGDTVVSPPRAEEVDAVLEVSPPHVRLALAIAADAGLRAGEVRGLEWQDIDLDDRTLTVRQTIYYGKKDTPKSGHQRKVPLTVRLYRLLYEAASKPHQLTDIVAPNAPGKVWAEPSLNHAFTRAMAKAKLPATKLHDLRHYFVTHCFKVGGGAPTVQALAGHKHMHVTARYAHTDEQAKRDVIERLGKRVS